MANYPELEKSGTVRYYGSSDLIGQIADELNRNPESCFAVNVMSWYNALYSAADDNSTCDYQVSINQDLCEENPPSTTEEAVDLLLAFVSGDSRRVARQAIRVVCRRVNRRIGRNRGAQP